MKWFCMVQKSTKIQEIYRGSKALPRICVKGKLLMLNCSINLELVEDSNRNHVVLPKLLVLLVVDSDFTISHRKEPVADGTRICCKQFG